MITFLLVPLLISGYILLTTLPSEKVRLSLYTGWSLYLRAATYGFFTLFSIALFFSLALPAIGKTIGLIPRLAILPDTDLISVISDVIEANVPLEHSTSNYQLYLYLTSLSLLTCALLLTFNLVSNNLSWCSKKTASREVAYVKRIFAKYSPLEYTLFTIGENYQEVFEYNYQISLLREKAYEDFKTQKISKEGIREVWKELEFKDLNFALITLENGKFYIGRPILIPPPDEESIFSSSITLMPLMSGYRNEEKELVFTTEYDFDLNISRIEDSVSFSVDKILTVSGFNFDNHHKFKKKTPKNRVTSSS